MGCDGDSSSIVAMTICFPQYTPNLGTFVWTWYLAGSGCWLPRGLMPPDFPNPQWLCWLWDTGCILIMPSHSWCKVSLGLFITTELLGGLSIPYSGPSVPRPVHFLLWIVLASYPLVWPHVFFTLTLTKCADSPSLIKQCHLEPFIGCIEFLDFSLFCR